MPRATTRRVDWSTVHATLKARAETSLVEKAIAARADRLLDERTRVLARPVRSVPVAAGRVLVLLVGTERYALPIGAVREVAPLGRLAALPGVPAAVRGIANWRGEFVIVCDLGTLVGAGSGERRRLVVLAGGEPMLALAVDQVEGVAVIDRSALQPAEGLSPLQASTFAGAAPDALLILDPAALAARLNATIQQTSPAPSRRPAAE